ncbi:MAG: hypothetical protein HOF95_07325 [Rhodospirillales bacterium]|jgi:hypothetical protein|nr:hypothetical protein [Rhodospirillales bacterium]MBT4005796.1 hypothetical protein [Rhodospirillales bacterium]MBT5076550.1 hypothetical protein [Rhodospirillales bacterium]MBT5114081.1 hypothetical protein [Rhodospirillales bacterium]MBT5672609.1 hypothetical protein [Rhodospirillales bacterium]
MQAVRLNEIYEAHKDKLAFYLTYIQEAHPANGWQTPQNLYEEIIHNAPTSDDERAEVAGVCQTSLDLKIPMLLDSIDNDVVDKYRSAPIRLFVVNPEGIITFNGAIGPRGYDLDAWEEAIKKEIA